MVEVHSLFSGSTCDITSDKIGKVHYRLCDNGNAIVGILINYIFHGQ